MSVHSSHFASRGSFTEVGQMGAASSGASVDPEVPAVQSTAMATSQAHNTSSRSLLGGLQRRLSNSSLARSQPAVVSELWTELSLVKRNILSNKPWVDELSAMWIVISNTLTSALVGWLFAFVYAIGSPTTSELYFSKNQKPTPAHRASLAFSIAVGVYFLGFACLSHSIVKSFILSQRLHAGHVSMSNTFRRTLLEYIRTPRRR